MTLDAVYDSKLHQYRCDMAPDQPAEATGQVNANASELQDIIATILEGQSPVTATGRGESGARRAKRVSWRAPLDLGVVKGFTRDISASGVFFETVDTYPFSSLTYFEMALDMPHRIMRVKCFGEIVRIVPLHHTVGVAVRLIEASIEARPD